jgi:hypothetical protein
VRKPYRSYRKKCLEETGSSLEKEMDYLKTLSLENPKNYQIWAHMQYCVENLPHSYAEKEYELM